MEKIICDVCGTSYPESSVQCPICGYAKPSRVKTVANDTSAAPSYVHVKGGRFSSANVRKRNGEKGIAPVPMPAKRQEPKTSDRTGPSHMAPKPGKNGKSRKQSSNMVLGITAIVLLLILIAVLIFFIVKVIDFRSGKDAPQGSRPQSVQSGQDETDGDTTCRQLHTSTPQITFTQAGATQTIQVSTVPAKADGTPAFYSSDPAIATVDSTGTVTAVASGETSVIIRQGEATLIVKIYCEFASQGSDNPANPAGWSLNREEMTLFEKGETWDLYSKSSIVSKTKITWTTEDPSVATVDNGIVEAVGKGTTMIHATYNDTTYSCKVHCRLPASQDDEDDDKQDDNTDQGNENVDADSLRINKTDVTIAVKESFELTLKDKNGNVANVTWEADVPDVVSIEGNTITCLKRHNAKITVSTTFEGETYSCVIRFK